MNGGNLIFDKYEDLITVAELMECLFIGKNKAYGLVKSGEIHAVKVGNSYRIHLDSVKEFVGCKQKSKKFTI